MYGDLHRSSDFSSAGLSIFFRRFSRAQLVKYFLLVIAIPALHVPLSFPALPPAMPANSLIV